MAIMIIEVVFVPNQIRIIGPKATFGRLFKIVKYGSNTLANLGKNHKRLENIMAINKLITKLINISNNVVLI